MKDWRKEPKGAATEFVFFSHRWGNSLNAGKNYKRSYNKTLRNKGE